MAKVKMSKSEADEVFVSMIKDRELTIKDQRDKIKILEGELEIIKILLHKVANFLPSRHRLIKEMLKIEIPGQSVHEENKTLDDLDILLKGFADELKQDEIKRNEKKKLNLAIKAGCKNPNIYVAFGCSTKCKRFNKCQCKFKKDYEDWCKAELESRYIAKGY